MRFFIIALFLSVNVFGQSAAENIQWIDQLNLSGGFPEKLLSTRTAVFYDYRFNAKDRTDAQSYFQRTGIDAVVYFQLDMLKAGADPSRAFSDFLMKREIQNLVFMEIRDDATYRLTVTLFNGKETIVDPKQNAWSTSNKVWTEALKTMYRSVGGLKKTNLLINDFPEMDGKVEPIVGRRNEFYAIDLKVDPLAVPKTGDAAVDAAVEEIFKANYPLKYKMTEPGLTEKELRKQGSLYALCYIKCRAAAAKELLGYDMTKSESALVSVTYSSGQAQLKNIPSNTVVYKFYFKHIDSGNVFLGTKWDADYTFEQALLNQLKGLKAELKLN
ncbi:hypothetical protein [Pseudochryseolinea flava]|uniref:Uncharacterized protein n=1 Tax=Pseudochryseolinea flava TaxID=2059302 RepID=A0A364YA96_9BACT|nr:hypothetical protein [Pseudochryseolinea flava]RAW03259.1 hypothetical protein DQQ10_04020 [Pseudochryseolinea flava]